MFNKYLNLHFIAIILLFVSCQSNSDNNSGNLAQSNIHKVITTEVVQASAYTYLKVKDNNKEAWLAVPSMVAKPGETYYYTGGLVMTNFNSKELNRTFESIIFLQKVSTDPTAVAEDKPAPGNAPTASAQNTMSNDTVTPMPDGTGYKRTVAPPEKKQLKVEPVKGGITIKELFSNKASYAGKTVKIKGQVTKYTPAVMNKNWIHIQDGTDYGGKFDLAVTSDAEVVVGETVVLEGKISLDKDLGYGYFFEVIMEEAQQKK